MTIESEFFDGDDGRPPSEPGPNESLGSASRSVTTRPSLRVLLRGGLRALRRFPGLVLALYLIQVVLSAGAALVMMMVLARAFATRPLFDRAMDGDIAALLVSLRSEPGVTAAVLWIGVGAVLLYAVVSWFLTAGLVAVLLDAPSRRREVVRWFGAAGASNFFPFLRLAVWSALPYVLVLVVAGAGLRMTGDMEDALDLTGVLARLGLGLGAALVLHWFLATAIDYARIDLVRHPGMSSGRALLRGFRVILRHRLALAHSLLYGLVFVAVGALYVWIVDGGALELAALIALRQAAGFVRFVAHVVLIAGQVELACAAMGTPLGRRH